MFRFHSLSLIWFRLRLSAASSYMYPSTKLFWFIWVVSGSKKKDPIVVGVQSLREGVRSRKLRLQDKSFSFPTERYDALCSICYRCTCNYAPCSDIPVWWFHPTENVHYGGLAASHFSFCSLRFLWSEIFIWHTWLCFRRSHCPLSSSVWSNVCVSSAFVIHLRLNSMCKLVFWPLKLSPSSIVQPIKLPHICFRW